MVDRRRIPKVPAHIARWVERHPPYLPAESRPAVSKPDARTALERYQFAMRRYAPKDAGLPWNMQSECPTCGATVPSTFSRVDGRVVLSIRCVRCGEVRQEHEDAIFTTDARSDRPDSPEATYSGTRLHPALRGLPRTVETLCPECGVILLGRYYESNGRVMIEKTCPDHGYFRDCVNSDARLYLKAARWSFEEPPGMTNPRVIGADHCPSDCGLCNQHQSSSVLGQIDLSNRCNLTCPVCFASANQGDVYAPTFELVEQELQRLLDLRPIPCTSIQFTGGEPTLHPRWFDILRRARELGMSNVQAATNGVLLADLDFALRSQEAGLQTLYLQFDGTDDLIYRRIRGRPLLELKLRVVENCRRAGMKICLVPTVIKGETDDQVAKIFDFAVENIDVVSGISFQPVCFTGRISRRELESKRYTLGDLAHDLADHTGADLERDFLPLSFMAPLSNLLSAVDKKPKVTCSCHSDCALGTYFFVAPKQYEGQPSRERVVPIPAVFDIPRLFTGMNELAKKIGPKPRLTWWDRVRIAWLVRQTFRAAQAPPGMTPRKFVQTIQGCVYKDQGRTTQAAKENYRTLLAAGMHFQDRYNFDAERAKRCVILYSTPEGVFPFCTWNSGPTYRTIVEAMHRTTAAEVVAQRSEAATQREPVALAREPAALAAGCNRQG
jgi:hypothetical protein